MIQRLETKHKMKGLGISDIGDVAMSLGISVVIIAVMALILVQVRSGSTNVNFTAVVDLGLVAITGFANWFNIIITIAAAVIILSLVYLLKGRGGQG
jgi:predicted membrane protein